MDFLEACICRPLLPREEIRMKSMKKVQRCLAVCMMMALLFSACGTTQAGTQPTSAPKLTEAPEVTAPAEGAVKVTEAPASTDGVAEVTDAPVVTEPSKVTSTPEPTATPKPTVTPYPVASTKRGDIVYELDKLTVLNTMNASVNAGREDGLMLQYDEQWGEVRLLFPEGVDLKECMYISLKMNTQGNNIMFQFYDEQILKNSYVDSIEVKYHCVKEGTDNYVIFPSSEGTVYAMGISAGEEVKNDKEYSAIAYDVTFAMVSGIMMEVSEEIAPDENGEITFTFAEMKYLGGDNASFDLRTDGSVKVKFDAEWGQGFFALPQGVDMSQCNYITIKLKSEHYTICTKLLDQRVFTDMWNADLYCKYDCGGTDTVDHEVYARINGTAWGVGIMAMENLTDFSEYTAEVYSITFHMKEKEEEREIQPAESYSTISSDLGGSELESKWEEKFADLTLTSTMKKLGYDAPALAQHYGADPCAMVYDGRVYVYMTGEKVEYNEKGEVIHNPCRQNSLFVMSSEDLVNWTDHGEIYIGGKQGIEPWVELSWAPTATYKEIDGEMKFFIYYAANVSSIEVLVGDSPVGPFHSPLEKPLISYDTPNCADVEWLFDPAVLMDDDKSAYLYFGGGTKDEEFPKTTRVVKLGEDMISIVGEPVTIEAPYVFEDSAINKIGDTYYYSYCTRFGIEESSKKKYGMGEGQIVYATSDHPMGPFTYQGVIFKNPEEYFPDNAGNNHHSIFEFYGEFYITYHARLLCNEAGLKGLDYRSSQVAKLSLNGAGEFETLQELSRQSVEQVKCLNPYEKVEAETMATMGGIGVTPADAISKKYGIGNMEISDIQSGDWVALYGVDFGDEGATKFTAAVRAKNGGEGAIQIRLDEPDGEVVGYLDAGIGADGMYHEITADLLKKIIGEHTVIFVFSGEGFTLDYWTFQ